ncbi:hypothetical protein AX774_g1775 [Zancudomyces culisetae]|uniref:Uncharacterized protein n=1 Tax=Zancudomyces culisetae TaxID=1213189 RepID=A0A1R1PUQ8_ZANCU|nr:hypothetical protein AX774_g1775 [Zancudomyces culisetae]|eukprot:OMH84695.1 hypothetical protein AX774_g1775 [Zancudomyces culisetae]
MAPGIAISVKSSVNSKALEDNTEAVEAKELGTFGREESPKNSLEKDPYAADIQHDVRVFGKAMQESPMDIIRKGITAFTLDTEGDRFSSGESIMDEKIEAAEKKLRSVLSRHENNSGNTRNIAGGFGDYNGFIKNDNGIPITYDSNASLSIQMGLKLVSIDILKRKSQHSLGPTKFGSLVSVEISKNSKQQEMEENNQHGRYSFRKRTELSLHPYTKFTWTKPGQVPYGKYNKIDLSVLYEPGKNKKKHIIINKAAGEGGEGSSGEYYNGDAEESAESDVIKSAELLNEKIDKPASRINSRISQRGNEHRPRAVKRTFKKRRKAAIGKKRVKTWINQLRSQEGSKTYGTHKKNVAIKDRDGLDMDIDFDMDSSLSDLDGISEISRILRSQNSFLSEQKNEEYNSGINKGIKEKSANTVKHNINVDDSDDSGSIGFVKGYHYNFARQNLGTQGKKRPRVILTDASSKKSSIEQSDSPVSRLEKRKNKKPLLNKKSIRGVLPASFLRRVYRSNSNVSSSSDYGSRKATIKPKTTFRKANRPKTGIGRKRGSRHSKRGKI